MALCKFKNTIKNMKEKELHEKLQELETNRQKMSFRMREGQGTSKKVRNYPLVKGEWKGQGNIRDLNKMIAIIKTKLSIMQVK